MFQQCPDESFQPRVDYDHPGNSDHVPTYIESHGNYQMRDKLTTCIEMLKQGAKKTINLQLNSCYSNIGKRQI